MSEIPYFSASSDGLLNEAQQKAYQEDGCLILENFIPDAECDTLRHHMAQLLKEFDPQEIASVFSTKTVEHAKDQYFQESGDKIRFFFEEAAFDQAGALQQEKEYSINKVGHALHDLDPVFNTFSYQQKLQNLASCLPWQQPQILQSMYIFKQPHIGGEVSLHQDSTFLYTEPESVVGFWFALEDATQENGCLWAIPKCHHAPLRDKFEYDSHGNLTLKHVNQADWSLKDAIPLEVKKGTVILLHGRLPHYSAPNRSSKSRHAFTLHAIDATTQYSESNWLKRSKDLPLKNWIK